MTILKKYVAKWLRDLATWLDLQAEKLDPFCRECGGTGSIWVKGGYPTSNGTIPKRKIVCPECDWK